MGAAFLGLSGADGSWHGFGSAGWWIETNGPITNSDTTPRTYNASLPPTVASVALDPSTLGPTINTIYVDPGDRLRLPDGTPSEWCSNGGAVGARLAIAAAGSYRGMLKHAAFSAAARTFRLYKADGTTLLSSASTSAQYGWVAWEADESVVLELAGSSEGSYVRYQGILFDPPRRAWLGTDGVAAA